MIEFILKGFAQPQAYPVKIPFSNWIYAANDDEMRPTRKK